MEEIRVIGTIGFIGGGAMAEAMIKGIIKNGLYQPTQITASDPLEVRRQILAERYAINTTTSNPDCINGKDVIVLAIKPQSSSEAMSDLRQALRPEQLVLSIVAGLLIRTIEDGLAHHSIVRVMPNTPAQIEQGMSVWTATGAVTEAQHKQAGAILRSLGREVFVPSESYLDAATAVNGSGPAYVLLFLEAFIDAGVHIGLSRPIAQELAVQTILGSVLMARETGLHPAELRNMVTSPAGTTAAALYELEAGGLRTAVLRGVIAAYERSKELGRQV
jgi:pyrroline-5-carboxylate reductase